MADRSIRVSASFQVQDRPTIPGWPVEVTLRFATLTPRASPVSARIGDQYLKGVAKHPTEPVIVGYLARPPRPGDEVVIQDGAMELPTGIRYGGA
jgi:hypothetical protein